MLRKSLLLVAACLMVAFICMQMPSRAVSIEQTLHDSWGFYKSRFLVNSERVASNHYGGTISEGQSYTLLKSVWMDDPATFERVWQWTRRELRRPEDNLLAWQWGKRPDASWGVIGIESATDADQDIAYALLIAGEKWDRPDYIRSAQAIIADLWEISVYKIEDKLYLSSGTWEGFQQNGYLTLNPSYFAPYVYRKFAEYDPAHAEGWRRLADEIYDTLEACTNLTANQLPPNWCGVRWEDLRVVFSDVQGEGARDFGYDAFRVFWRMSMDAALGSERARAYLKKHSYLLNYWQKHRQLPEGFTADGQPKEPGNSGFVLSAAVAQLNILSPQTSAYQQMLAPHYHPEGYWFNDYNDFLHSVIWLHLYTLTLTSE